MVNLLDGLPDKAPAAPRQKLRFADVAVTATAREFKGIYRGKQYHAPDFDAVLRRSLDAGVEKVMLTGMSLHDVDFNLDIARRHPEQCSITVGVHPYHAAEPDEDEGYFDRLMQSIRDVTAQNPTLLSAYGELGLDYDHLSHASKEAQIRTFRKQLDLFVEHRLNLPLFLHCRAAFDDFVDVVTPYVSRLPRGGLVHSFVGSVAQMETLVDLGFDISVNGFSFRDRESVQMAAAVPLEKLQIETDAPWGEIPAGVEVAKRYLKNIPVGPARKKRDKFETGCMVKERNESCAVDRVAFVLAGPKGVEVEEVAEQAWRNSSRMFRLERD